MKTMLTRCLKGCLGIPLLLSLTALPSFGQDDLGLGPIDPASIADLLPDDEYAPKLTIGCVSGTCVVISWKGDGILQVSSGPNGPWQDLWNAAGKPDGFGIFERWILRLGYFIKRRAGLDAAQGDLVVFFYPTKPVSSGYRDALVRYVEGGGKLLILDSPLNEKSTAAALLEPFHLSQRPLPGVKGTLSNTAGWPAVPVEAAHEIIGGQALFHLDSRPVGAVARRGKGAVVAIGFGSRFADPSMGITGDVVPDAELRRVFDLQFALLRAIVQDQLPVAAPAPN